MTAKCAEALGLRKAYPRKLSGIYTSEEMQQAHADEDSRALEVFSRTQAAIGIHGRAKLSTTRAEHAQLWDEARYYDSGSLLPVYLSETGGTLEKALTDLVKKAKANAMNSGPAQPGASRAAHSPEHFDHTPSPP